MSVEHEFLRRLGWGLFFTIGLITLGWAFGAFVALPAVLAFVLYFTLTKRA
jgi:hypothetical protein